MLLLCLQVNKKQVLNAQEVKLLCDEDAKLVFRQFADLDPTFQLPSLQLRDAEQAIIKACAGLPLALRLAGALLSGNDKTLRPLIEWEVSHQVAAGRSG